MPEKWEIDKETVLTRHEYSDIYRLRKRCDVNDEGVMLDKNAMKKLIPALQEALAQIKLSELAVEEKKRLAEWGKSKTDYESKPST